MSKGIVLMQGMIFQNKKYYFYICSYKSLAYGSVILGIIVIADNKVSNDQESVQ